MLERARPYRFRRRRAFAEHDAAVRELDRIVHGRSLVVAGPWLGGVGMELLYWIPLLRWLTTEGDVRAEHVLAISRGGAEPWYADVSGRYLDLLDGFSVGELKRWERQRLIRSDSELEIRVHPLDRTIFDRAAGLAGGRDVAWLHPATMHRLFAPRWEFGASVSVVASHTAHRLLPDVPTRLPIELPSSYAAVKITFNRCFPKTDENRAAIERAVSALSERTPVVLLRPAEEARGHEPYTPSPGLPVIDMFEHLPPRESLGLQTKIVRDAEALLCTYGGFSFVGPFVGTPTLAFYSDAPRERAHLDAIDRVGRRLVEGVRLYRARHIGSLDVAGLSSAP